MTNTAIQVDHLSKQYRIGSLQQGGSKYKSLREELTKAVRAPIRRAGRLLRGEPYGAAELDETIWALKDVSFEVKHGEAVGIIGANGAGKTTLLKILSRITEPTEGRAVLHGRVGSLLEVGTGFHPELTGRENIYLNGAILGMTKTEIERKFDEIVAFSGVEQFIDTPVKHYSSGMRVRLAFSVAAHLDPEILLIDEVLAVGDAAFQKKCLGKMGEVRKEGRTILLVSHNLPYVTHVCRRAILLEGGSIVASGNSVSVVESYAHSARQSRPAGLLMFDTSDRLVADGLRIPRVEVLSCDGMPLKSVRGGKPVTVRIHYQCEGTLVSPGFGVTFSTLNGTEVLRLSTLPISGYEVPDLTGVGHVDCVVDHLPLTGGVYALGVFVTRPNVEYVVSDSSIGSFEIRPYDAYGSGFGVDRRCGVVTAPHHWKIQQGSGAGTGIGQTVR